MFINSLSDNQSLPSSVLFLPTGKYRGMFFAMELTIEVPDSLKDKIAHAGSSLGRVLECGFKHWSGEGDDGYEGEADLLEIFANFPTPQEVIELQPSEALQARVSALLTRNRETGGLSEAEELEWQRYERLEQLVRKAKAKARLKLTEKPD